jgi:hypothetical protein
MNEPPSLVESNYFQFNKAKDKEKKGGGSVMEEIKLFANFLSAFFPRCHCERNGSKERLFLA